MRFKVKMKKEGTECELPINYQYELMSAIYSIFAKADKAYADSLHENDNKRFKPPSASICYRRYRDFKSNH